MNCSIYKNDEAKFHKPNKRSVREQEPLKGLVDLIRELGGHDNKYLYYDVFPFSVECEVAFPVYEEKGHKRVKDILTDIKRGHNVQSTSAFLAWLWYRHEKRAKELYDRYGFEHHPYTGNPNLDSCPKFIIEKFEFRDKTKKKSFFGNYLFSISKPLSSLPRFYRIAFFSILILLASAIALVIQLEPASKNIVQTHEAIKAQRSEPSIDKPNTFCVFPENNISIGKNTINGEIMNGLNTPFVFNPNAGDYFHATENIYVLSAWSTDEYVENKIDLFSKGRPVKIVRSKLNGFKGVIGDDDVFSFEIEKETGKFRYVQYDYLDQPISSDRGFFITLSFEYHLHRKNQDTVERFVQIDVYDSEYDSQTAIVNGLRQ